MQRSSQVPRDVSRPAGVRRPGGLRVCVGVLLAVTAGCSGRADDPPATPPRAEATQSERAEPTVSGTPRSAAALGDSITKALLACGFGDCPQSSWSTGSARGLDSHSQRISRAGGHAVQAHNLAVSGATVSDLADQARAAISRDVEYVTVLIGTNNACAPTEDDMTPVAQYAAAYDRALTMLARGLPRARILAVSIPDLQQLWRIGKDRAEVRATWDRFSLCQSMLGDPASTGTAATSRRLQGRERILAYNRAMAASCARHPNCRWDGFAVFNQRFSLEMLSPADYFHPSVAGQRALAEVAWKAGYWP